MFPLGKLQDFPHVWCRAPPECPPAPLILAILTPMTLVALLGKGEPTCNTRDPGLIPGSGRSPGEGNGYPLQYACLGDAADRGAWRATVHGVTRVRHDVATNPPPPLYSKCSFSSSAWKFRKTKDYGSPGCAVLSLSVMSDSLRPHGL